MNQFVLTCCSTADMKKTYFDERQIPYVCFHYLMDGVSYPDDLGQSMPFTTGFQKAPCRLHHRSTWLSSMIFLELY